MVDMISVVLGLEIPEKGIGSNPVLTTIKLFEYGK